MIATDGSQGTRDYAKIPAGAQLAAARAKEASCAATRLGVKQLHIVGLLDGGLASFETLGKLRTAIAAIVDSVKPAAIITFGPEGGTGHPDHRLTGNVTTQVVQADPRYATSIDLLYASLPTERLRTAPRANPTVTGMAEALLTVRVPFEEQDLVAGTRGVRLPQVAVHADRDGRRQRVSGARVERHGVAAAVHGHAARSEAVPALTAFDQRDEAAASSFSSSSGFTVIAP